MTPYNHSNQDYDDETLEIVHAYEAARRSGTQRYFDEDEMEMVIDYYIDQNDIDKVEQAVDYAQQLFPEATGIRLRRGILLINRGQHDKALPLLLELERMEPQNTDVQFALGELYSFMDQPMKSIQYYLAAAKDQNGLDLIYTNIANEYSYMHRNEEAIYYYKKALAINPEAVEALQNLAFSYDDSNRLMDGEQFFSLFLKEHPYSKEGWYILSNIYNLLSLFEKAIDAGEYALAIDRKFFHPYLSISQSYLGLNQPGKAASVLLEAVPFTDQPEMVYNSIGDIYHDAGNLPTAIIYYRKAVDTDPFNAAALCGLAHCYTEMNDNGTAATFIDRAIQCSPPLAEYHFDAAQIHARNMDIDAAEEHFKKALDLDNSQDDYWLLYAVFLYSCSRYQDAIDLLESGVESAEHPDKFDAVVAACYFKLGHQKTFRSIAFNYLSQDAEANSWMDTLLHICPESSEYLF